ncbi:unnamed protein product [Clonostachys rosea]|uniref:SH3 domain-containing protein n=1 Tax=Bionectria ochroleuca TaxID=29856 RepID=A0ABY6U305_BIOOC|nr:unnamed protein product [Clonostachys rosea]
MDEVEDLVLTPFRDIVEKAKQAALNAGDDNPEMLKAANTLSREGDRGLRRIEPLCHKQLVDYGPNFVAALKDNDQIANFRSELTDLLWEFEDYIEVDEFDASKFSELQAMSRKAAPKIYDILMRLKLEVPFRDDISSRGSFAQMSLSTPTSPPVAPIAVSIPVPVPRRTPSETFQESRGVEDATAQLKGLMRGSGSVEGSVSDPGYDSGDYPPKPPLTNPWDWTMKPGETEPRSPEDVARERMILADESPVLPSASDATLSVVQPLNLSPIPPSSPPADPRLSDPRLSDQRLNSQRLSTSSTGSVSSGHSYSPFPHPRSKGSALMSYSIPENSTLDTAPTSPSDLHSPRSPRSPQSPQTRKLSAALSVTSEPAMPNENPPRSDSLSGTTLAHNPNVLNRQSAPAAPGHPHRYASPPPAAPLPPPPQRVASPPQRVASPPTSPATSPISPSQVLAAQATSLPQTVNSSEPAGLGPVPRSTEELAAMDFAPIPVDSEQEKNESNVGFASKINAQECMIDNTSSFWIAKGFCDGAQEVIRGGIGIKRTKKPVGYASHATIARCTSCLYELDFTQIEADVNKEARGNFSRNGINFRVRFLQKSHLATKRIDDVQYGCIYCIRLGHTLDKSDATVFFNQKALFDHLARHPRPLPEVPGVVTIEGPEMPAQYTNDYDIHFPNPPQRHPCIERREEIMAQPSGVSKDQARRIYGQMLLYDRTPALELGHNARITGITWPEQYLGDWCFAWHDGVQASVPFELIRFDPPPSNMIRYDRSSLLQAKARWKFSIKEKNKDKDTVNWLKFDKGDVITNISYVNADNWCWTGTNSKGKTGIFPKDFIDTKQLHAVATPSSARALSISEEKNRSLSVFSKLGKRKNSTARPPSIAGSTSSHETGVSASRNAGNWR